MVSQIQDIKSIASKMLRAIPSKKIHVSIKSDWLSLEGEVDSELQRSSASLLLEHLENTYVIINNIKVASYIH